MKLHTRLLSHALLVLMLLLSATVIPGCTPKENDDDEIVLDEQEDPFNQLNTITFENAKITQREVSEIPQDAFSRDPFDDKQAADSLRVPAVEKLHPVLRQLLNDRPGEERIRILINFRDDVQIPRFPQPFLEQPRDSRANQRATARAQELIDQIQQRRAAAYDTLTAQMSERYQAEVIATFWLINAMTVEAPLQAVRALLQRDDVVYIEPDDGGEQPPQNANNNDDVQDGRALIVSDPYFNLGQTNGYIGLLDTGLRFTHVQFNSPSTIDFRFDCTDGACDNNPDITDDCWNHGTSTAAIITGNNRQGNAFRGITGITLDSFKIYPAGCGGLNGTATVQAFQTAVAVLDRVIVAEMQSGQNDTGAISTAADNAFDSGAVIIAANGNNGPGDDTVNAPAIAHKVIGVGNFDVQSQNQINSQSRGAAPDNRFKPDIQAPTNTETASNASDTAFRIFGGTSGATPYASGAAALLRNWLRGNRGGIDPGQVYAQLILSGSQPYPFNNTSGAGPIRMPVNGWGCWGKVSVRNGETINIRFNVPGGAHDVFDGALWWPETAAQTHNDIDLHLIDPNGVTRDFSISIPSVFERARVTGTIQPGTWTVRIRGFSVPTGSQTVYWTAVNTL